MIRRSPIAWFAVALSFVGACSAEDTPGADAAQSSLEGNGLSALIAYSSSWGSGYCADVALKNVGTTTITSWQIGIDLNQTTVTSSWSANFSTSAGRLNATPLSWNATLSPGATTSFGFCANAPNSSARPAVAAVTANGSGGGSGGSGGTAATGGTSTGGTSTTGGATNTGGTTTGGSSNTGGASGGPAGYTFCADENQRCTFTGTRTVAYGANGTFVSRTATGGIDCNNATFGDPISGVRKACYVSESAGTGGSGGSGGTGGTGGSGGSSGSGSGGSAPTGFYQMEDLNRGVVAVPVNGGIYVGWRLFGYDPDNVGFNVYRGSTRVNSSPITSSTNLVDSGGSTSSTYTVRPVVNGVEQAASETARVWSQNYLSINTSAPSSIYTAGDSSVGDVDGDGQYEIFVKWDPSDAKDNSQSGVTSNVYLDAYRLSGERLWRIDLGRNIRAGAHYTQFVVYDFDGDGRAEMAVKTAPGTRDGTGAYLRTGPAASDNDSADYRNSSGYILTGPEYLTVFNGLTGAEMATVNFEVGRGTVSSWGDSYGNRVDRFNASMGFVTPDGRPSIIMARGYYTRTTVTAWNWNGSSLTRVRLWDSNASTAYTGQGTHSISIANVDSDKPHEIISGASTLDDNGTRKCSTGQGHGDALHVTDLVPSRPGLEVFQPHESGSSRAYTMRDANTCAILWQGPSNNGVEGPGRGVAADITPANAGSEAWVNSAGLFSATSGSSVGGNASSCNFVIWWDADLSRELLNGTSIRSYDGVGTNLDASGCSAINGTKSTPNLSADLIGDWREEVIFRCGNTLRIYTTTAPATNRIYTLMHDAQYREAISWQNSAYNQPPHPSFHVGQGMANPPKPDIHVR